MEKTAEQRLQERLEQLLAQKEAPTSAYLSFSKLASTQLDEQVEDPTDEEDEETDEVETQEEVLEPEEGKAPVQEKSIEQSTVKVAGMDYTTLAEVAMGAIMQKLAADGFELSLLKSLYGELTIDKAASSKKALPKQ